MDGEIAAWGVAGTAVAAWIVRETWAAFLSRKKERTETDANVTLVQGLTERIQRLEQAQETMTARLEREIELRMSAQEEAHKLKMRIYTLETAMRAVGAVIPPEPTS